MELSLIRFVIAAILITGGVAVMCIATFGVFRLNTAMKRMHAAAMGDSLGILLVMLGIMVVYGLSASTLKVLAILALFWCASPVCSHLVAKLEAMTNLNLEDECEVPQ
ncbi:MAG: monovalent cation/H(+) antiporter subunit G [Clostridiales bacterium]|nr:monovalent cation/H(+) antiporter subunit G [Clostridiales bacterium]